MATNKVDVILPVLRDREGDISKDWFIEYFCFSEKENKLIRYRKTYGLNRHKTKKARIMLANKVIARLSSDLKDGWRPWNSKAIIYKDNLEYENIAKIVGRKRVDSNQVLRLFNEFSAYKKRALRPKSYSNYVSKLRIFNKYLENNYSKDIGISELDNALITKFYHFLIDERELDKITIDKYTNVLNGLFVYLEKKDFIDKNPMFNLPQAQKIKDEAARPINRIDLKIILTEIKKCDPQLHLACLFQYYIAIRPGNELRNLKIKDIDFYNNTVLVSDLSAKTGRRTIDMPKQLVEACFELNINKFDANFYVFGKFATPGILMLSVNTLRNRFNKIRDRLNLPKTYKFYSMKHTGGGMLLEAGASIEEIRAHMGHHSIESTDHYLRRHFGNRNKRVINEFPSPY